MRQQGCGGYAAWAAAAALCVAVGCGDDQEPPGSGIAATPDAEASSGEGDADAKGADPADEDIGGQADGGRVGEDLGQADAGGQFEPAGDRCQEAFVIDLSESDQVSVSGDQGDFTHRWDAQGRAGCSLYEGEPAGKTDGQEVFLRLSGHGIDEHIEFDAEGGGTTFAFYLLEGCEASSCVDSGVFDEQADNRFVWRATTAADIWVAAEVFGPPRDRPFEIVVGRVD